MVLSARAIGGGVGAGIAVMVLGWVGTTLGLVSGKGQGGAKAFNPVLDGLDTDLEMDLGATIDGRLQSSSAGDPAVMVTSLEPDEDRDRDWNPG